MLLKKRAPLVYPTTEVLERDLLLATSNGNEVAPTVAGLLLFGRDERCCGLTATSRCLCDRFSGDSLQSPVIEKVKLTGNLISLYEGLSRFIVRYCDLHDARPRGISEDIDQSGLPARANYHRGCRDRSTDEHAGSPRYVVSVINQAGCTSLITHWSLLMQGAVLVFTGGAEGTSVTVFLNS